METIFFYITFIILIFSSIGHGIIFGKFFNIKADLNIGTYGLLGLANLTLISYISILLLTFFIHLTPSHIRHIAVKIYE